jgi:hypothetical protein
MSCLKQYIDENIMLENILMGYLDKETEKCEKNSESRNSLDDEKAVSLFEEIEKRKQNLSQL